MQAMQRRIGQVSVETCMLWNDQALKRAIYRDPRGVRKCGEVWGAFHGLLEREAA